MENANTFINDMFSKKIFSWRAHVARDDIPRQLCCALSFVAFLSHTISCSSRGAPARDRTSHTAAAAANMSFADKVCLCVGVDAVIDRVRTGEIDARTDRAQANKTVQVYHTHVVLHACIYVCASDDVCT